MNKIQELRKKNGLTQTQLATMLGITQANLSGWETDKWQPDRDSIFKMCEIFNVSADYLIGRTQEVTSTLHIPDEYKDLPVAFYEGTKGLTQADIDSVINFMEFLKNKGGKNDNDGGKSGD